MPIRSPGLAHQLDYQLFGAWAGGHHLMNLAIHAANSVLLFLLLWRLTRDLWPSAFVAALFAIHPLHVESVAWVAERKDVLSGLFFMLTLHAYAAYATKRQVRHYVAGALFVRPRDSFETDARHSSICLVAVRLLAAWPHDFPTEQARCGRSAGYRRLILEKIPFAVVAGAWSILTFVLQKEAGVVGQQEIASSHWQCHCQLCHVFLEHVLAAGPRRVLSIPGDIALGNGAGLGGIACSRFGSMYRKKEALSLSDRRLVMVLGNAGAGNRSDSGRSASARRSLHLLAADRTLVRAELGDRCANQVVVRSSPVVVGNSDSCTCAADGAHLESNCGLAR